MKGKIEIVGMLVSGTGTEFLKDFRPGDGLLIEDQEVKIRSVADDTLILEDEFPEDIETPARYGRARYERTETWT